MHRKVKYTTKQGEAILAYIASLNERHITVEQIADYFEKKNTSIGLTTIYRHLDKLVQNGTVRKYSIDGVSGACYQYITEPNQEYLHLKCEACGDLQHLECDMLNGFTEHIFERHNFGINPTKTVLYGKCKSCAENK